MNWISRGKSALRRFAEETDGVWRTVNGRRVFIKKGETVQDALQRSLTPQQPAERKRRKGKQRITFEVGETVRFDGQAADGKVSGSMDVKVINPHSNKDRVTHTDQRGEMYEGASRHVPTATVETPRGTRFEAHHHTLAKKKV